MIVSRPYTVVGKSGETRTEVLGEVGSPGKSPVNLRSHTCPATKKGLSRLAYRKGNPGLRGCCLCRLTGRPLVGDPEAILGQLGKHLGRQERHRRERVRTIGLAGISMTVTTPNNGNFREQ